MAEQVGAIEVRIGADPSKLKAGLASASKALSDFGSKATSVGRNLSLSVTAPLVLAGRQAIRASNEFEGSMTKIKGLVGVAGAEVDRMGETAKKMAANFGASAAQAGDALFYITSAGLRGAEAMDVLEASLKASAAGLGEASTVADLATSALNAYGTANISAIEATDILTKSVREGKLETTELAASMGRVLPVASAMGVRFEEVGAAFAALSRTGTNAAEAATQIRGILSGLLTPGGAARAELERLKLSAAGIRQEIKEKGLLSALETLKTAFNGNEESAALVFGNVRALSGVMDLLGANVETTREIFDSLTNSTGATNSAFEEMSKSGAFKLQVAQAQLNLAMTEFGDELKVAVIPALQQLAQFLKNAMDAFKSLDEDTRQIIVKMGLIAAAIGPVLLVLGQMAMGLAALSGPIGIAVLAVGALTTAFFKFRDVSRGGEESLKMIADATDVVRGAYDRLNSAQSDINDILKDSTKYTKEQVAAKKTEAKATLLAADAALKEAKAKRQVIIEQLRQEMQQSQKVGAMPGFLGILQMSFQKGKFDEVGAELSKLLQIEKGAEAQSFSLAEALYNLENATLEYGNGLENTNQKCKENTTLMERQAEAASALANENIKLAESAGEDILRRGIGGFEFQLGLKSGDFERFTPWDFTEDWTNLEPMEMPEEIPGSKEMAENFKNRQEMMAEVAKQSAQTIAQAFSTMGGQLFSDLQNSGNAFQRFVGHIGAGVTEIIGMLLANAISNAIVIGSQGSLATGPAAPFTLPAFIATSVGAITAAFGSIPAFAQGGMVTGPTLAMVGDNASGKEAIIPFEKMGAFMNMMGGSNVNVNITGEFDGDALRLVLDKSSKDLNNLR